MTFSVTRPRQAASVAVAPRVSGASSGTPLIEILGLLVAPAVLFWFLSLRAMAPVRQPDPSMHSTFLFDPHGLFSRFGTAPSLSLQAEVIQDSARVGFLVPARLMYLLFGAAPGFFVYRYLLALVATIPLYLLLRRLYGSWAGWVGAVVVMSSPVLVGTWGSDYASSGAISYLLGGQAALALSLEERRWAKRCLLGATVLATLSVWTNAITLLVIIPTFVVYLMLRWKRDRDRLGQNMLAVGGVAVLTTVLLAILSKLLLGYSDFIAVTIRTGRIVNAQDFAWHSASWAWAPYDLYLLVPPAILVSYFAVVTHRRGVRSSVLLVGLAGGLQLLVFAYLQFFNHYWVLETPLFSCYLWAGTSLMLAMLFSEIMAPSLSSAQSTRELMDGLAPSSLGSPFMRAARMALPAVILLVIPIVYEGAPHLPPLQWSPWGYVLGLLTILVAVGWRTASSRVRPTGQAENPLVGGKGTAFAAAAVAAIASAILVLTVAPEVVHTSPPNTSTHDPAADYSSALGGKYAQYFGQYLATSELWPFVGKPSHPGEQLVMWVGPNLSASNQLLLLGPIGLFGSGNNLLPGTFPSLSAGGKARIRNHHAGQVLLMSTDGTGFAQAVQSLAPYGPTVVRRAVLGNNSFPLHVWLVDIRRYQLPPTS